MAERAGRAARLSERAFARWYPPLLEFSERAGQRETRAGLLARADGRTLEIGAGAGHNLAHYSDAVTELVLGEPGRYMTARLLPRLAALPMPARAVRHAAEALPFADDAFDTVVTGFVLCSVTDPGAALREIARVLRPGGRYLFLEHVRSPADGLLARVQDLLDAPHTFLAAGCHPNRRTEALLHDSPLRVECLERGEQPRSPATVRPTIRGVAVAR